MSRRWCWGLFLQNHISIKQGGVSRRWCWGLFLQNHVSIKQRGVSRRWCWGLFLQNHVSIKQGGVSRRWCWGLVFTESHINQTRRCVKTVMLRTGFYRITYQSNKEVCQDGDVEDWFLQNHVSIKQGGVSRQWCWGLVFQCKSNNIHFNVHWLQLMKLKCVCQIKPQLCDHLCIGSPFICLPYYMLEKITI